MKKNLMMTIVGIAFSVFPLVLRAQDFTAAKIEIQKLNAQYSNLFTAKDQKIVTLYCEDGHLIPPNARVVSGRAELTKDFQTAFADGKVKAVNFTTSSVYGCSSLVAEEGKWEVTGADGKIIDRGNYIKLWKKSEYGLKIFRDIFNSEQ